MRFLNRAQRVTLRYGKSIKCNHGAKNRRHHGMHDNGRYYILWEVQPHVIVGSSAVCPQTGKRVGKGEGFAELEWGILSQQGNLDTNKVLVVTSVHDCQVFDIDVEPWKTLMADSDDNSNDGSANSPFGELTQHDVPVDIIVTPTRIIHVPEENRIVKPSGVYWDLLSPQKLASIRVLQELKKWTENKLGETLPSGPDEVLPPIASRKGRGGRGRGGRGGRSGRGRRGRGKGRG